MTTTWYPEPLPEGDELTTATTGSDELTRIASSDPWGPATLTSEDQKALRWEN